MRFRRLVFRDFLSGWGHLLGFDALHILRGYPADLLMILRIELLICVSILMILVMIALHGYTGYILSFKITNAVLGSPFSDIRVDMSVCHAITGAWPADTNEAARWGAQSRYAIEDARYLKGVEIEKGAVHFTLKENLSGSVVTMRPAVPKADPFGPVVWFCTVPLNGRDWNIAGADRTDVPQHYIPLRLR